MIIVPDDCSCCAWATAQGWKWYLDQQKKHDQRKNRWTRKRKSKVKVKLRLLKGRYWVKSVLCVDGGRGGMSWCLWGEAVTLKLLLGAWWVWGGVRQASVLTGVVRYEAETAHLLPSIGRAFFDHPEHWHYSHEQRSSDLCQEYRQQRLCSVQTVTQSQNGAVKIIHFPLVTEPVFVEVHTQ